MRNPGKKPSTSTPAAWCMNSKAGVKRGPWTPEEDEILSRFVAGEGEGRWRTVPKRAGLMRCGKSCRLRWMNYLRPSIKHGHITPDEEDLILRLHRLLGNRWSLIAGRIPGRTDNEIKNYWNTHLSKKLISQGIDPTTHKPFTDSNPNPNPNPNRQQPVAVLNPNPNSVHSHQQMDGSSGHGGLFFQHETNAVSEKRWRDDGGGASSRGIEHGFGADDGFSLFLDSLINDDMFVHQQHQLNGNRDENA